MPHLPARFEFDVLWLITLFQQAKHTFKDYKVFVGLEITCLPLVDFQLLIFGIYQFLLVKVYPQVGINGREIFVKHIPCLLEAEFVE
jgi:hypothetical protein